MDWNISEGVICFFLVLAFPYIDLGSYVFYNFTSYSVLFIHSFYYYFDLVVAIDPLWLLWTWCAKIYSVYSFYRMCLLFSLIIKLAYMLIKRIFSYVVLLTYPFPSSVWFHCVALDYMRRVASLFPKVSNFIFAMPSYIFYLNNPMPSVCDSHIWNMKL